MTLSRLARTKQLPLVSHCGPCCLGWTYYARGNESRDEDMTSAMQMVADLETPTRQCTNVAIPSDLPFSIRIMKHQSRSHGKLRTVATYQ
jgi:hypothetical protein